MLLLISVEIQILEQMAAMKAKGIELAEEKKSDVKKRKVRNSCGSFSTLIFKGIKESRFFNTKQ